MNFRERRVLRQKLWNDIIEMVKDGGTEDDIKDELKEKYSAVDWNMLLKLIMELLPIILKLFSKT